MLLKLFIQVRSSCHRILGVWSNHTSKRFSGSACECLCGSISFHFPFALKTLVIVDVFIYLNENFPAFALQHAVIEVIEFYGLLCSFVAIHKLIFLCWSR